MFGGKKKLKSKTQTSWLKKKKWEVTWIDLFLHKIYSWPIASDKILITNYQKLQTKTTMGYHFIPFKMIIIKKYRN